MQPMEYEQTAVNTGGIARWSAVSLFLLAAALVLTSINISAFRAVFQLAALFVLTVAVLLTVRFVVKKYVYRTERQANGDFDFVIVDVQAKKRSVAVRLSFATQITGFTDDSEEIRTIRKNKQIHCYPYCTDFAPKNACALLAMDGDERVAVIFQPNETMRQIVRSLMDGLSGTKEEE